MRLNYTKVLISLTIIGGILAFVLANDVQARPQYSTMRSMGTKCNSCHINQNLGGQRNFAGWLASSSVSIVDPSSIGIGNAYGALQNTNAFWDDRVSFGIDYRLQNARWAQTSRLEEFRPGPDAEPVTPTLERQTMQMQLMPYLNVQLFDWLAFDGGYNFAYDIEDDMRYPGQQPGYFSAKLKVNDALPSLRVGFFQPMFGIDYDDHTVLVRQVAGPGRSTPLFPADYAEFGAQLNYDAISWLNLNFGMFGSSKLSVINVQNQPIVNDNTMSTVAGVSFHPTLPFGLNSYFGVSHFLNGGLNTDDGIYIGNNYFYMTSYYMGIGMSDRFSLITEYITSEKQSLQQVDNWLFELTYQVLESAYISTRYETASTQFDQSGLEYEAESWVFSGHLYPLPYIHFIPEYRIYDRGDVSGYSSQWAFQLHIYY